MSGKSFNNISELIEESKKSLGHSFKDYDIKNRLSTNNGKGNLGQVIEEGFFGYDVNSNQEPDFANLGVELKVTPYKYVNKGTEISAKERLVLTMINYMNDYDLDFKHSNCFHKLDKILMMFYEHEIDKYKYDYIISKIFLYQFNNLSHEDQNIIVSDYKYIMNKIKDGKAHLISESDTFYLGACPKGATKATSMVDQPFSKEKAMRRAFTLKSSYMTQLLRSSYFKNNSYSLNSSINSTLQNEQSLITDYTLLEHKSLSEVILSYFTSYEGKTLDEIDKLANKYINRKSKSYLRDYTSLMLKSKTSNPEELDEFKKANIKIKTIRINKNGSMRESMSFPSFRFKELVNEEWEDSSLRNQFISTKYLFCIFDEIDETNKEYRFRKSILWNMPESDLDTIVKKVWDDTKSKSIEGIKLNIDYDKNGLNPIVSNNLIKKSDEMIVHVRPHASKRIYVFPDGLTIGNGTISRDGDELPNGIIIPKQCFFLNNSYILQVLSLK